MNWFDLHLVMAPKDQFVPFLVKAKQVGNGPILVVYRRKYKKIRERDVDAYIKHFSSVNRVKLKTVYRLAPGHDPYLTITDVPEIPLDLLSDEVSSDSSSTQDNPTSVGTNEPREAVLDGHPGEDPGVCVP